MLSINALASTGKSIQTEVYNAQPTRSIVPNPDWSKQIVLLKCLPTSNNTSQWPKVQHQDLLLTSL